MTRALLDVGVLLALMDPDHVYHERVHRWFAQDTDDDGWASCALTQNGFVRILSQPRYPNPVPVAHAVQVLRSSLASEAHEFWPCDVSLTDDAIDATRLLGHRQVTDTYLLALAVAHRGRFVTLDSNIDRSAVPAADDGSLVVLD
ncbi:TA system VapC family ribonuclease toxin [Ornithinimicrobium sp. LYQ121]|uniref:TA system VapC family ribonuclease toxin n=1 Tax=Ornithinimicrobium sp. LYQ121 TaxID=3378801 RepID=UPI0038544A5F